MELSIIIPIYNAEKYLVECLNSVQNIYNIDFECLMIDDGSSDNSKLICEKYVNERFKYIYKTNSGVSSTRNYGMRQAKGKHILFLDADDYLNKNIEESIINAMKQEIDFTVFDYKINLNGKINDKKFIQEKDDILEDVIYKIYATSELNTCWGKLFNKKIIQDNGLEFYEDIKIGEDQIFVMEYINLIKSVQYVDEEVLTYRINQMSAMNKYDPNKRWSDLKKCYGLMNNKSLVKNSHEIFIAMNYSYLNSITYYFRQLPNIVDMRYYYKLYNLRLKDKLLNEIFDNIKYTPNINILKKLEFFFLKYQLKVGALYFFIKGKIMRYKQFV